MVRETGKRIATTVANEEVKAFVPHPLPPAGPALSLNDELKRLLAEAEKRLAELKIASELVPNVDFFAYAFVRKEAVFSSQIEGIQATLSDLLSYEAAPEEYKESRDVLEVCNYLDALHYGRKQLSDPKGLPLSMRLVREMHKRLMRGVRGHSKNPGEFRSTQNWIGGTRPGNAHFVPPPPNELATCLDALEKFIHSRDADLSPVIRIGLIHVQFETIHPFLDGNGRLGRVLIGLLLETWYGLDARLLYLSLFFKKHHLEYYRRLDAVRADGDWEGWIRFFLEGVCTTAKEAIETAQTIFRLFEGDRKRLVTSQLAIVPAIRLYEELSNHPVITIAGIVKSIKTTKPTAAKAVEVLSKLGILRETTGGKRNRIFGYRKYLEILKGDEP